MINIPEPTLDSWAQFFKNINQMSLIVTLLVFSGILVNELSKGTLINMLTKGLSRRAVILSKYTSMVLIWTLSVVLSFLITWVYTVYLFPDGGANNLLFSVFCLWLYGCFLLAVLMLSSTITRTNYATLILVGLTVVVGMLVNIVPKFQKYNPLSLSSKNMDLLVGSISPSELYVTVGISLGLIVIALILSIRYLEEADIGNCRNKLNYIG